MANDTPLDSAIESIHINHSNDNTETPLHSDPLGDDTPVVSNRFTLASNSTPELTDRSNSTAAGSFTFLMSKCHEHGMQAYDENCSPF